MNRSQVLTLEQRADQEKITNGASGFQKLIFICSRRFDSLKKEIQRERFYTTSVAGSGVQR